MNLSTLSTLAEKRTSIAAADCARAARSVPAISPNVERRKARRNASRPWRTPPARRIARKPTETCWRCFADVTPTSRLSRNTKWTQSPNFRHRRATTTTSPVLSDPPLRAPRFLVGGGGHELDQKGGGLYLLRALFVCATPLIYEIKKQVTVMRVCIRSNRKFIYTQKKPCFP